MTSRFFKERSDHVDQLCRLATHLPSEISTELQPDDIGIFDEIRRVAERLWKLQRQELVFEDLQSLRTQT